MGNASRTFGQYEIIRRLGSGGMAETFEARRWLGGAEQRVCLKRVLPAFSQDPRFKEQFLREARLATALRHSNIVSVLDFGAVNGSEFMVLELVEGLDLRALLSSMEGRRLDAEFVSVIALDLAFALSYAHNTGEAGLEGVVHRDISPANVLVSVRGEVKLADFGIAKAMTNAQATASGVMKGKIPYMSPEQMCAGEMDGRTDLFSLGVTLYEALAGERPFQGAHDVEVMTRLMAGERRPLAQLAPTAPKALVRTIEALLETDRVDRTANAEALVDALGECGPTPLARRRLAELVQQQASMGTPKPGQDRTDLGPLDTELEAEFGSVEPPRAPAPAKTNSKRTSPSTPALVQAANAAAAALRSSRPVSKSTMPASPSAIASSPPPSMPVPQGTMPASPSAIASSPPPSMPVPQGTMPASPRAMGSVPAPSPLRPSSDDSWRDRTSDAACHQSSRAASRRASDAVPRTPYADPEDAFQHSEESPNAGSPRGDTKSDDVVLPFKGARLIWIMGAVGVLLIIGSGVAIGLRSEATDGSASGARIVPGWGVVPDASAEEDAALGGALNSGLATTTTADVDGGVSSERTGLSQVPQGANGADPADAPEAGASGTGQSPTGGRRTASGQVSQGAHSRGARNGPDDVSVRGTNHQAILTVDSGATVPGTEDRAGHDTAQARAPSSRDAGQAAASGDSTADPSASARRRHTARAAMHAPVGMASGSARVMIRAEPWGSLWVDGRYIGRSPVAVILPIGAHVLGGGVGHIMSTVNVRVTGAERQEFVLHLAYPQPN